MQPQIQAFTETCKEIDISDEIDYQLEQRYVPGKCCPETIKTACKEDDNIYNPGETWMSKNDRCKIEMCEEGPNGIAKQHKIISCAKECPIVSNTKRAEISNYYQIIIL